MWQSVCSGNKGRNWRGRKIEKLRFHAFAYFYWIVWVPSKSPQTLNVVCVCVCVCVCKKVKVFYLTSVANRQRLPSYMGRRCESRRSSGSNPQPFAPKSAALTTAPRVFVHLTGYTFGLSVWIGIIILLFLFYSRPLAGSTLTWFYPVVGISASSPSDSKNGTTPKKAKILLMSFLQGNVKISWGNTSKKS